MRHAPLPPHFLIDHFKQVESIRAPKYTGAGIPPGDKTIQLLFRCIIKMFKKTHPQTFKNVTLDAKKKTSLPRVRVTKVCIPNASDLRSGEMHLRRQKQPGFKIFFFIKTNNLTFFPSRQSGSQCRLKIIRHADRMMTM